MRFDDTLIGIKHCRDYRATASIDDGGALYCTGMFTVRRPIVSSVTAHTHANGTNCEEGLHSWLDSGTNKYDTCGNIRICNAMKCPSSYLRWSYPYDTHEPRFPSRLITRTTAWHCWIEGYQKELGPPYIVPSDTPCA